MNPRISLIISVYNNLPFLKLTLAGVRRQTALDQMEVIISDDGSNHAFTEAIPALIANLGCPARHVWHPDNGFQKNAILNKSVQAAKAPYILFIDGDCIPHRRFVESHLNHARPGFCLTGRRVNLDKATTQELTEESVQNGVLEGLPFSRPSMLFNGKTKWRNGLYLPGWLGNMRRRASMGLIGCHMSMWKQDLLDINGFNEGYTNYGIGEDTDLEMRLRLAGIRVGLVNNLAIQYHLWHPQQVLKQVNLDRYFDLCLHPHAVTEQGIKQSAG